MNTVQKLISFLLFLVIGIQVQAQDAELPKIMPPSPEVAALGKYGDVPVGHFTGVPNISIPLVTLQGKSLNIPVSLSYHAGGIRVNEIASRVGLGWNLNVGGMVSRSVRGLPDDYVTGYLHTNNTVEEFIGDIGTTAMVEHMQEASQGYIDYESDVYNFNFLGYSGKFYYNQTGDILIHPAADFRIEEVFDGDGVKIKGWKITVTDGTMFYFGLAADKQKSAADFAESMSISGSSLPETLLAMKGYISAWHLVEIVSNTGERVQFNYTSSQTTPISFWNLGGQSRYFNWAGNCNMGNDRLTYSKNMDRVNRISSIVSTQGKVVFDYQLARQDLNNDKALTSVILYDNHNKLIDNFDFHYDYFISMETFPAGSITYGETNQRRKRLYLKDVEQIKLGESNKKHSFVYNTQYTLPDRMSFSQDAWGYYNGQNNAVLYPSVQAVFNAKFINIPGANRRVFEDYAKACMLEKITYPTGGSTEFDFESNTNANPEPFFATNTTSDTLLFTYRTDPTLANDVEFDIDINDTYNAGFIWSVDFDRPDDPSDVLTPYAELYKGDNSSHYSDTNGESKSEFFRLDNGETKVKIIIRNFSEDNPNTEEKANEIRVMIHGYKYSASQVIGGLRVKEIRHKDKDGSIISKKFYKYNQFDDASKTSGLSLNPPIFIENKPVCIDLNINDVATADVLSSHSVFPLTNGGSSAVGYTNVTEFSDQNGDNGKIEYTFSFAAEGQGGSNDIPKTPLQDFSHRRGLLLNKRVYKKDLGTYKVLEEVKNTYKPVLQAGHNISSNNVAMSFIGAILNGHGWFSEYQNISEPLYKDSETVTSYFPQGNIVKTTKYTYEPYPGRYFPLETETSSLLNNTQTETYTTKTYFPGDLTKLTGLTPDETTAIEALVSAYRIATPIQSETYRKVEFSPSTNKGELLSTQRTLYNNIKWANKNLLEKVQTAKGADVLEDRIVYHQYDDLGNAVDVSKIGKNGGEGTHITYIWGYNQTLPIAKLENIKYDDIDPVLINWLQLLSNADKDKALEDALRVKLQELRDTYPQAMISTYTYDPLVGVTSVTDPRGQTSFYEYDTFNRLKTIKDADENIIQVYDYKYHND